MCVVAAALNVLHGYVQRGLTKRQVAGSVCFIVSRPSPHQKSANKPFATIPSWPTSEVDAPPRATADRVAAPDAGRQMPSADRDHEQPWATAPPISQVREAAKVFDV